jgi:hypothetical protein
MSAHGKKRFLTGDHPTRAATELAETFPKIPALVVQFTRCGKARCRCTAGRLHGPYHYLRWREGTAQRRRYVRARDVPAVRAILEKRREHDRTERLVHALSLRSWRQLARLVEDYEARIHEERERL